MTLEEFKHENDRGGDALEAYCKRNGFSHDQMCVLCDITYDDARPISAENFAKIANPAYSLQTMMTIKSNLKQMRNIRWEKEEQRKERFGRIEDRITLAILEN